MSTTDKHLSFDDALFPTSAQPSPDVREWQKRKIKAGLTVADTGRFASSEAVKAVIQKFVPNG